MKIFLVRYGWPSGWNKLGDIFRELVDNLGVTKFNQFLKFLGQLWTFQLKLRFNSKCGKAAEDILTINIIILNQDLKGVYFLEKSSLPAPLENHFFTRSSACLRGAITFFRGLFAELGKINEF